MFIVRFQKYVAVGELGKATDTLDATGMVILEKEFGKFRNFSFFLVFERI